jgi:lipopolysaccharide biosynthesis protein
MIRPIAIYLPQFHPIPENDEWWGKGFTEWTNVTKAKPLFDGHYQPHLPADLGFYDLRLGEAREAQAQLAQQYGIEGFCYYHYWFNGKRILERPFNEVLQSGKPDFPFMLCWANENWTRVWDGGNKKILLQQDYSEQDDMEHIRSLIPAFKDKRYIRVNGKCVFAVYRSTSLPNPERTINTWKRVAAEYNIELYLCRFESFGESGKKYLESGFDAAIRFEPFSSSFFDFQQQIRKKAASKRYTLSYLQFFLKSKKRKSEYLDKLSMVLDYGDYVSYLISTQNNQGYKYFPGITPMWDNSARRKHAPTIFHNSTPEHYKKWLLHIRQSFLPFSTDENFVFINAWNEWAEGNHLEPCQKWGRQYLEATYEALKY